MSWVRRCFFCFLAVLIILPLTLIGAEAQRDKKDKEEVQRQLERQRKLREAQLKDFSGKIEAINGLIKSVNQELQSRASGQDVFDRKLALENQLRDVITNFALLNEALGQAERLGKEVREIQVLGRIGPRDVRRRQLANFLEARRQEYIRFATR